MQQQLILYQAILPGLAALAWLLLAWRPWRRPAHIAPALTGGNAIDRLLIQSEVHKAVAVDGRWAGGLALASACLVTQTGLIGWPPFPPEDSEQWPPFAAMALGLVGVVAGRLVLPSWLGGPIRAALALVAGWLFVPSWFNAPVLGGAIVAAGVLGLWMALDEACDRLRGPAPPLCLMCVAAVSAKLAELSGNAKLAHTAGALSAGLGAALMLTFWRPTVSLARGAVPVFAGLLVLVLFNSHAYGEGSVPLLCYLLAGLSPFVLLAGLGRHGRRLPGFARVVALTVLTLVPLLISLVLALRSAHAGGYGM